MTTGLLVTMSGEWFCSFNEIAELTFMATCTEWNKVVTSGLWDLLTVTFGVVDGVLNIDMYKGGTLMCNSMAAYPEDQDVLVVMGGLRQSMRKR